MKHLSKTFTLTLLTLVLVSLFSACEYHEAPVVEQNEPIISINYAIVESDWQEVSRPGENGFFMAVDLDVPEITTGIVNSGLVLLYYREQDSDPWIALPFTRISHDPEFIETFDFIYDTGFVGLQSMASDRGATPYTGTVRIVIADAIPVGKMSLDTQNYEAVAAFLGITEKQQRYRFAN
ncbi:MAG: hypothetical protein D6730_25050 [Bacteroidetes bacterium]|nr:MAG: hypothetical protein D6730_25050 [Bacteroidota bacterium]